MLWKCSYHSDHSAVLSFLTVLSCHCTAVLSPRKTYMHTYHWASSTAPNMAESGWWLREKKHQQSIDTVLYSQYKNAVNKSKLHHKHSMARSTARSTGCACKLCDGSWLASLLVEVVFLYVQSLPPRVKGVSHFPGSKYLGIKGASVLSISPQRDVPKSRGHPPR